MYLFPKNNYSALSHRHHFNHPVQRNVVEEYQGFFFPYKLDEVESLGQVAFRNKSPCETADSVSSFEDVCSCPKMDKIPSSSEGIELEMI